LIHVNARGRPLPIVGGKKESAMTGTYRDPTRFSDDEAVVNRLAQWMRLWRVALSARNEIAVSSPEEVAQIAAKLGIIRPLPAQPRDGFTQPSDELPNSAALLRKMMGALGIDPDASAVSDLVSLEELQRFCARCEHKPECARDLAQGTATENFYAYCPNAQALDSMYVEMTFKPL
jgi:uncharacterized protein DUF6455